MVRTTSLVTEPSWSGVDKQEFLRIGCDLGWGKMGSWNPDPCSLHPVTAKSLLRAELHLEPGR